VAFAYISAVPLVAILINIWIIFTTAFKPSGTLCCFWGWMIIHVLLLLPDVALNIVFTIQIMAPFDPAGKTAQEIANDLVMKMLAWFAPICIMIAALEVFAIIGYIIYSFKLRKEGNSSQAIEM